MDRERTEDLNPRSQDVEEKVRQMLDPNLPDSPSSARGHKKTKKPPTIKAVSSPLKSTLADDVPSAPPVTPPKQKPSKKTKPKAKKIISPSGVKKITIADHDETPAAVAAKLDANIAGLESAQDKVLSAPELAATRPEVEADTPDTPPATPEPTEAAATEAPDPETPLEEPAVITDPATDRAVADIVAAEGDEILEIEDAVRDTDEPVKPSPKSRNPFKALAAALRKPRVQKALLLALVLGLIVAMIVPHSRYFVLNTVGVRASSSLTVFDDSTRQPLKNVRVSLGGASGVTDDEGNINLRRVKLGRTVLRIEKLAFATVDRPMTVGWGSNPLGDVGLKPTGVQYSFTVTDYLSDKPVAKVAASTNDADALGDEKGKIKLTIDKPDENGIKVTLKHDGYRTEELTINPDDTGDHAVKLVPARKHVYVSKRTGKFDVYGVYLDGKDERVILAGSGNERDDMVLAPHPRENIVAYVSTRAGQKNSQGFVLSNLVLLDLNENDTTSITAAEQIRLISWAGDRLLYVQIAAGSSGNKPDRYRLMSYNFRDGSNKELAKSNFFNDVIGVGNFAYYAPSSAYQIGATNFYSINADGSNNTVIFNKEVWNVYRTAYDHLAFSVQQQWYDLSIGSKQPTKLNAAPAEQISRVYIDSPDGKRSAWIDSRDGKGVVLAYDQSAKTDKVIQSKAGITYPVSWLSSSVIIYRVKTNQETADYAVSVDGGEPVKIRDVTNTSGFNRWSH